MQNGIQRYIGVVIFFYSRISFVFVRQWCPFPPLSRNVIRVLDSRRSVRRRRRTTHRETGWSVRRADHTCASSTTAWLQPFPPFQRDQFEAEESWNARTRSYIIPRLSNEDPSKEKGHPLPLSFLSKETRGVHPRRVYRTDLRNFIWNYYLPFVK